LILPDQKIKPALTPAGCDEITAGRECHDSSNITNSNYCQLQSNSLAGIFNQLKEIVAVHEMIFDEAGEAVDYRIIGFNTAFLQLLGKTGEEVKDALATGLFASRPAPYISEYESVLTSGQPKELLTFYPPLDRHFSITAVPLGQNLFATVTNDITTSRQMHELMSARSKELENYLYVTSHDLRTPLVNIQGFSQRLNRQVAKVLTLAGEYPQITENEELKKLLEEGIPKTLQFIFAGVNKMDSLLNGLLQLSRTGRATMSVKPVDMNQLLEKIIETNAFQLSETGASVKVENLPGCYGDENLLNQMFSNLISNAVKYRDPSRNLVIEISAISGLRKAIYSIKDNGTGIEKKHLDQIWNLFYRIDDATSVSGDGIGLSVVKKIAEKHRGKVKVESEPGVGSVFSVVLQTTEFQEY
ncbi:MAG TPA: HAMP domain-containing sensor histidine kinase, partial [Candidatus Rifleibacterium sp.]|nr:HAMP domain-containing sensor histidine kinase [Candidatus Rifleibacterium sp.]